MASALMGWINHNLFITATGAMLGASAVGALKAAQNLMGVMNILFFGLENVVPTRAAWHYQRTGLSALVRYIKKVAWVGETATAAVAILFATVPEFWLRLIYGEEYAGYGGLVRWFAAIYLVLFIAFPLQAGLRALEQTSSIFRAVALATVVAVATAYPLVSGFGITGAVVGMLLVQMVKQGALMKLFAERTRSLSGRHEPNFTTASERDA